MLDRVVLAGLIGSTNESAFRIGKIVDNLRIGNTSLTVRIETVQETLQRLIVQKKVRQTELFKTHVFCLTESAHQELSSVVSSAEADFDAALKRMLKDTAHLVEFDVAASICRRFILECFARSGKVIAKTVTGRIRPDELPRVLDTRDAFKAALEGHQVSPESIESVRVRCDSFLKSSDPNDQQVKFHLTQSYYFAQLLGFEDSVFNPLQDHAFANAILYLDTNVVIAGVLYIAEHSTLFDELITLTKRLGVELRVTRATLNETRYVAHDRLTQIKKIVGVGPDAVLEHTNDQFLIAFLNSRERNASLTPDEFIQPFDRLAELLIERWHITIEDRAEDDVLADRNIAEVCRIIDEEAENLRGWGKSEAVQAHDACHYVLVKEARSQGQNAWFLTRDRTLVGAAARLAGQSEAHFCFSLIGFLHSISPFVTTAEESSFVNVLSTLITDQVFAVGPIFDAAELALLAEFHDDVMATPTDQLLLALDYIKSKTLEGKPYRSSDIPKVSLELRKFLSSSKDEQYRALEVERMRLEALADAESKRRVAAEQMVSSLQDTGKTQETKLRKAESEAREGRQQAYRQRLSFRALLMLLGLAAAVALWMNCHDIVIGITTRYPRATNFISLQFGHTILNGLGALAAALPTFAFVLATRIRSELKLGLLIICATIILGLSNVLSESHLSFWSNCFGVAGPITVLLIALWNGTRRPTASK